MPPGTPLPQEIMGVSNDASLAANKGLAARARRLSAAMNLRQRIRMILTRRAAFLREPEVPGTLD